MNRRQSAALREPERPRTIVISGGSDGMGRALALSRAARGDAVIAIGSNAEKGRRLLADAPRHPGAGRIAFLRADLSSLADMRGAVAAIVARHDAIDALALLANRVQPRRQETRDGLESTFAVYYLSRQVLGEGLTPLLARSASPVIVSVAGVGVTKGRIHWDDLQLAQGYGAVAAQLQAGRAIDLLGVAHAGRLGQKIPYVLYHPGFTRSGELGQLPLLIRLAIRTLSRVAAQPVDRAIAPIHGFIDTPPTATLLAVDRGRLLPLDLPTLDPAQAQRLAEATSALLAQHAGTPPATLEWLAD